METISVSVRDTCDVDVQQVPQTWDEWNELAGIVGIRQGVLRDPNYPAGELHAHCAAWAKRRKHLAENGDAPAVPRFTHRPWPGCRDWQNWAIGLDVNRKWHLFHFQRWGAAEAVCQWRHHNNGAVRIASGAMHKLAVAFITNPAVPLAQASKALVSRLRNAIRKAVDAEGHRPTGKSIQSPAAERPHYLAIARFGNAERVHRRWLLRLVEAEPASEWLPLAAKDDIDDDDV